MFVEESGEQPSAPAVILIVDDNAADRETMARFLSTLGPEYVVHQRTSVESGLAAYAELQPDCVLLDHALRDGTGLDFLRALPAQRNRRIFPVVMLTGSGSEEIAADAFKCGALDYLVKGSLTPEILHRAIRATIYKTRTEQVLDQQRTELQRLVQEVQEGSARKDQFLAALSHELRTPLSPILTAVSIDPETLSATELKELFGTIRRNVELERRLVDDLLDVTRIAKGKLRLEFREVNAHEILEHALDTCRPELAAKKLNLQLQLAADSCMLRADAARLVQVFWNLLKNAVKFTPSGGEVRLVTGNPAPDVLEIEISDSGCGIAPEVLPHIFNAFEQGGAQTTHRFGGLGLGLAISKALVEAQGGRIRAKSDGIGRGATFVVTLSTIRVETPQPLAQPTAGDRHHAADLPEVRGRVVLLVEDHADTARILTQIMHRSGFRVVNAGSVAEAIAAYTHEKIEVVVSDIGLPDGDGVSLMEQLRAIRPVPGIALTGYGTEHDHARSHAAGFVDHLTKPVDWPDLRAALHRLLQPSSG